MTTRYASYWTVLSASSPFAIHSNNTYNHFSTVACTDEEDYLSRSAPVAAVKKLPMFTRGFCWFGSGYFGFLATVASPYAGA